MTYVFFLLGFGLIYFVNRRKFNRRNVAGLEEYSSFEHAVGNNLLNKVLKVLAFVFILLGIGNCAKNMNSDKKSDASERQLEIKK
ncbi:MAG TPA: molybdenum ABC transporter permease [Dyadobacter sp.]|jgi:preprotein translocase subunit SecG|nr:molybdenum ABC transporter permease [Dyadobacter sp.]